MRLLDASSPLVPQPAPNLLPEPTQSLPWVTSASSRVCPLVSSNAAAATTGLLSSATAATGAATAASSCLRMGASADIWGLGEGGRKREGGGGGGGRRKFDTAGVWALSLPTSRYCSFFSRRTHGSFPGPSARTPGSLDLVSGLSLASDARLLCFSSVALVQGGERLLPRRQGVSRAAVSSDEANSWDCSCPDGSCVLAAAEDRSLSLFDLSVRPLSTLTSANG